MALQGSDNHLYITYLVVLDNHQHDINIVGIINDSDSYWSKRELLNYLSYKRYFFDIFLQGVDNYQHSGAYQFKIVLDDSDNHRSR